jgi:hypothetical protein
MRKSRRTAILCQVRTSHSTGGEPTVADATFILEDISMVARAPDSPDTHSEVVFVNGASAVVAVPYDELLEWVVGEADDAVSLPSENYPGKRER